MNLKQIVAVVSVLVLLAILTVPTLSTGTVSTTLKASKISNAEHVFVTLKTVSAHQTGESEVQGWRVLSNTTRVLDLVSLQSNSETLSASKAPVGRYDSVRVELANATWVSGGSITRLQLEASQLRSKADFTIQSGRTLVITITLGGFQETLQGQKFLAASLDVMVPDAYS